MTIPAIPTISASHLHAVQLPGWRMADDRVIIANEVFEDFPDRLVIDGQVFSLTDIDSDFTETDEEGNMYELADYEAGTCSNAPTANVVT